MQAKDEVLCLCDYQRQPTGVGLTPTFSWMVSTEKVGLCQASYNVHVWRNADIENVVWDSGTVMSGQTTQIIYDGQPLQSGTAYNYQVCIIDNENNEYKSAVHNFTTGILEEVDWSGAWIGAPGLRQHSYRFRSDLTTKKQVRSAAIFVASPNYHILTLNGRRVSDSELNNAITDFSKTMLYATYTIDVASLGEENTIGVELGNGWYALERGERPVCKAEHLFALMMRVEYIDGSVEWSRSGRANWHYTDQVPVRYCSIYHGETYDARVEMPGWDMTDYDMEKSGLNWQNAFELDSPGGVMTSQNMEPIRIVEEREVQEIYDLGDGCYTIDSGQNHAGWLRIRLSGERGTEIKLEYAELLNADKTINRISLKNAKATDTYILGGYDVEEYQPRFTYHGYRYVQISGLTRPLLSEDIVDCVVHTDVECIAQFESSDSMLNKLYQNMAWTERSNLHGLPTDCPQRDERLGWLNDMTVRSEWGLFNFRLSSLYCKWIQDIRDTQGVTTGAIGDTAPFLRMGQKPADPVGISFLLTAWNVYLHTGDKEVIERNYESFKRWVSYLKRHSKDGIVAYSPMGDWAAPIKGTDPNSIGAGAFSTVTPSRLMATGYQYYSYRLLEKMAGIMGLSEEAKMFSCEAEVVSEAFRQEYYNQCKGYYAKNSQAGNAFPLYLKMEEKEKKRVLDNIIEDIEVANDGHLTTGNLCSRYIIELLLENGQEDLAHKLLTQKSYPGWGYMINNGATTIWERWENITEPGPQSGMASHNHPMNGAVCLVLHKHFAGITIDEQRPGFENIVFKPTFPSALSWVKASINTVRGRVSSSWEKTDDGLTLTVEVPFNTTAEIYIPRKLWAESICAVDGQYAKALGHTEEYFRFKTKSGRYKFVVTATQSDCSES